MQEICGAPGCANPTALAVGKGSHQLCGIQLCRACYAMAYRISKKTGKTMHEVFGEGLFTPPHRLPHLPAMKCERKGCLVDLPENATTDIRKRIGFFHVCRGCFNRAWEKAKADSIPIEEAFHLLKPKGKPETPEPPAPVACCMPWCKNSVVPTPSALAYDEHYVCGRCRGYLARVAKRPNYSRFNWQMLAKGAVDGQVPAPHASEVCMMPWCKMLTSVYKRGPSGEAICHTDGAYLDYYAKRHNMTFDEAFRVAPKPSHFNSRFATKEVIVNEADQPVTAKEFRMTEEQILETLDTLHALGRKTSMRGVLRALREALISRNEYEAIKEWMHTVRGVPRNWYRTEVLSR